MDPNATWASLVEALDRGDRLNAMEYAEALLNWMDSGGFAPDTGTVQPRFRDEGWCNVTCRAVCELLWDTKRRLEANA